ncbi:glycosyltransferase [Ruminococcaceae bacterium OttesenSCG-928-A16]|nr:glycosyltransferase [Ruminococcaceae bacterium OttesenSCG-928-A16]
MTPHTFEVLMNALMIVGGVFALYGVYFVFVAAFGLKKPAVPPTVAPKTRFALVSAARNEAEVIPRLLESLHAQHYPKELFDIYVAPNNCTDNTREVALAHGALVFDPEGEIRVKGQVLTQIVDMLMKSGEYDAICFFDSDNLVHPNFLQKMNDAHQSGVEVAQGYRDTKNPGDSFMTVCYAIYYWLVNKFYNGGREALGLSSLVVGSGYMVSVGLLQQLGGWHTATMTEDYEFTAQCVLSGRRVHYVAGAVVYDELPLKFGQSWKQRRRWCTGFVQGMEIYLGSLFSHAFKKRSGVALDMALTYMAPALQMVSLVCGAVSLIFSAYGILRFRIMPATQAVWLVLGVLALAFVGCCLGAMLVVWLNRGHSLRGTGKGILFFAFFLLSWVPIGIICLFKKQAKWDEIKHTNAVGIEAVKNRKK